MQDDLLRLAAGAVVNRAVLNNNVKLGCGCDCRGQQKNSSVGFIERLEKSARKNVDLKTCRSVKPEQHASPESAPAIARFASRSGRARATRAWRLVPVSRLQHDRSTERNSRPRTTIRISAPRLSGIMPADLVEDF